MEADRETAPVERQTSVRTGAGAQRRGILWEREVNSHPVETSLPETAKPIANWVGRLQEYLVKYERGLPDYKFEESNDKIRNLYSATVKIPGVRGAYQATAYNKADAKQLAAKKMFNAISKSGSEGTQAAQASQDRLSVRTLRSYLKNHTEEKPANADSGQDDSFETFVDAFSKIDFEEGNPEKTIQTSIEVLKRLSTLEKFDIEYHDVPTTRNSYLCLLEAKIGQSLVCHGIGENRPQAMEKAAESMLELVRFFKHFKKER
ncbi:RISC-loading complex subunit tarbp2-like [Rhopilema esculentum]|uniref:RISC-loading complex subunit tarbp2-like n=1 Tax=Rhopilema esculentum TaxID=499914 RepID=UPI0031D64317